MSVKVRFVVMGALLIALLAVGVGGTLVLAQGPTTTPAAPSATGTPSTSGAPSTQAKTLSDLFWQAFAQRLGITVDKAQQAETDARKDALAQAVKQGLLTQAQADAELQRLQNAGPGGMFGMFGRGRFGNAQNNVYATIRSAGLDAAAKALGMSRSDLDTALQSKTLLTLAQEKNVDVTKLRTAIADAEKAAVDQAVKDSKLTQAQADSLKAGLTPDNIDLNRDGLRGGPFSGQPGRGFGPGMNGMGPMGPFRGPMGRQ
jgi:hypothetical protein